MPEKPDRFEIPGWVPPVLYAVLTAILFREFILTDRMLFGSDTLAAGYVARELYAEALGALGRIPEWSPHILGGTPFLEALSGGDSLYPPSLLLLLLSETYRALGWKLVLHVFAAGLFFFGWVRAIGGSRSAALLGGTAYMLAPFLVGFVHPGHDGKIFVTALAPLLFWATERHFARPGWATVSGIGLVVALIIYTTHFQMAYFLFGGVGLYAIFRAVQIARGVDEVVDGEGGVDAGGGGSGGATGSEDGSPERETGEGARESGRAGLLQRTGRQGAGVRFALFLAAAILGAGGAAYQFLPAVDYVTEFSRRTQTTREAAGTTGRAWSSSWSMHPEEAVSLLVPEFAGNQAGGAAWAENTYWGRNALKDNHEYAGLIVLLLAAISFVGARRKQLRWFLTALGLLALAFGLGSHTPVWGLFYAVVPGIRLFRAPGMVVFLFGFGAITLAALGVDRMLSLAGRAPASADGGSRKTEGKAKPRDGADGGSPESVATLRKVLWGAIGFIVVLGLLIGSGAFTSFWTTVVYPEIDARRLQILQAHLPNIVRGASVAVLLVAAGVGLVWGTVSGRIPAKAGLAGLVLLVAFDAGRIDRAFVETIDFHQWSQADANVRAILEREEADGTPYRLLSLARAGQDVTPAMHGIELAAGHHPNDLSRYRELIGMVGSGLPENLLNPNVRSILNVEYILWPDLELGAAPEGPVVSRTQLGDGRAYQTVLADRGLPRARLVAEAVVRSDADAVEYIMSPQHDPSREAVLAAQPPLELGGGEVAGSVSWIEREIDHMTLEVESDRAALLVIADNWFPAWRASVDGEETEVLRAYHAVRAVPVPAGSSTVEMWYESDLLRTSRWISLLVLLGLTASGAWGIWRRRSEAVT